MPITRRLLLSALLFGAISPLVADQEKPIRIACVGDSITFGAGVEDRPKNNYPAQLQAMLGEGYEVKNFGVSGATMLKKGNKPYWKLKQFQTAQDFQPDIVIIKLGTNDSKPGNWAKHGAEYRADYIEMIETFRELNSEPKVWICLPVPVFATRWGINEATVSEEVIPEIQKVAKETGVEIIDLYSPFEGKPELVPDKVHPNAAGAKVIAEAVRDALTAN
ncbi:MAG TPA: GDSL-type esterase/lipase family protein [Opitutales bacterium]|nr:GDSL-type esterase/lipase family protein [Opitutales bacterium]